MKKRHIILSIASLLIILLVWNRSSSFSLKPIANITDTFDEAIDTAAMHPLTIASLRNGNYQGSDLKIEETLEQGSNYSRYIASYQSEGNELYGLLTVPDGEKPEKGWPVIIFNHGYIPPKEYKTTERYVAYVDGFASNGYIVFKPDYRGHGNSEGNAVGGYGSNAYTIDVLNALASVKKRQDVDITKIGMWGHSMGGFLTLRSMVVTKDIKAGVIWGGVVANYEDLIYNWTRSTYTPPPLPSGARRWRTMLTEQYGTPQKNPAFWNSISANAYLNDISGPIQLHHGTEDDSVPVAFSEKLKQQMDDAKKPVELYTYEGDDHNITQNFTTAMNHSLAFFDTYVKGIK